MSGPAPSPARRRLAVGLLLAAACACVAAAAETPFTVRATADAGRIGMQDTLEFQVQVEGSGFTSVEPPDLSALEEFEILDGPRRVQRQTIVNGAFSAAVQFLWTLAPKRTGILALPAATVRVDGKPFRTQRIDVQVVEGSVASRVPAAGGRAARAEAEVLLVAEVDRRTAYVGEQVTFTLKLLTQARIRGVAYQTRPDFNGFWAERDFDAIEDPKGAIEGRPVVRDGRDYQEFLLSRVALFPTASGAVRIDPVNVQMRVASDRRDPFGSFFFDREQTILRRSAPVTVEVRPLPEEGRPAAFSGAVGDYRMEVATDRSDTAVNDAVALKVTVQGAGNIRNAGEPVLPALSDFRPFDPTVEESRSFRGGVLQGARTWQYVLVPLAPGEQAIPPIEFAYFDPEAGRYRTLRSEPVALRVARGDASEAPLDSGTARREVTPVRQDIHFIKLAKGPLVARGAPFHRSGTFLALLALPLLATGVVFAWRWRIDRLRSDVAGRRARGASKAFRARLREAEAARRAGRAADFHAAVSRALTGLVADRSNVAAAGLTREALRDLLAAAGAEAGVCREVESILDECDAARFSPAAPAPEAMQRLSARAAAAGRGLEGLR